MLGSIFRYLLNNELYISVAFTKSRNGILNTIVKIVMQKIITDITNDNRLMFLLMNSFNEIVKRTMLEIVKPQKVIKYFKISF